MAPFNSFNPKLDTMPFQYWIFSAGIFSFPERLLTVFFISLDREVIILDKLFKFSIFSFNPFVLSSGLIPWFKNSCLLLSRVVFASFNFASPSSILDFWFLISACPSSNCFSPFRILASPSLIPFSNSNFLSLYCFFPSANCAFPSCNSFSLSKSNFSFSFNSS